jgi:ribosome biogenesis protein MAK21
MKMVVIKETEQILFRLNMGQRTQYYAVTFLNQIVLSKSEPDSLAANRLIDIYFRLFEILVSKMKKTYVPTKGNAKGKKGKKDSYESTGSAIVDGIDSKMLSALLTGINRAFPYASIDPEVYVFS